MIKKALLVAILTLLGQLSFAQSVSPASNQAWKNHLRKFYLEADAGALFIFSLGASASFGYQFHPALGLGVTASGYSELNDYFPAYWSGRGVHYRIYNEGLMVRFDYGWATHAGKGDDRPFCDANYRDKEGINRYQALSINYRYKVFKFGMTVSRANLHFYQPCEGVAAVLKSAARPVAIVPTIGLSFGGKSKR